MFTVDLTPEAGARRHTAVVELFRRLSARVSTEPHYEVFAVLLTFRRRPHPRGQQTRPHREHRSGALLTTEGASLG
jgi:hypothetical protein